MYAGIYGWMCVCVYVLKMLESWNEEWAELTHTGEMQKIAIFFK